MPIEFMTCLKLNLMYSRWSGVITHAVRSETFQDYLADPNYTPGRPELVDLSRAHLVDWDIRRVQSFLHGVNAQAGDRRVHTHISVWAPTDDSFGSARMYQILSEMAGGIHVDVLRSEREALAVLKLPYLTIADMRANEDFLLGQKRPQTPQCPDRPDAQNQRIAPI